MRPCAGIAALIAGAGLGLPAENSLAQSTVRIAGGLASPTYATHAPGDFDRLFITERFGDIEILDLNTGLRNPTPFLSIPGVGGEGLQGLAFHPNYASNGLFYVYYNSSGRSQVVRYSVSTDPDLADSASALPVIEIVQPAGNHNGGWIGFGPDGFLYVPLGDGGSQHDPSNHGQTIAGDLLSTVLRLDVDADDFPADPMRNYAIPADNPFVGVAGDDEIWAYGLRNPFRSSFDRLTGDLYIADVGQDTFEEIDFQPAGAAGGRNYGWRLREGFVATPTGGVGGPQPPGGVDPIYAYTHGTAADQGNSITGGYVYRGSEIPGLVGKYFFADFENERIWSIEHDGTGVTEFLDWTAAFAPPPGQGTINQIVGFGEDAAGELYIVDLGGEIFRIIGSGGATTTLPTTTTLSGPTTTTTTTPPASLCAAMPATSCLRAERSLLKVRDRAGADKDKLKWKWSRGDAFTQEETGAPDATTTYALCVYDTTDSLATLVAELDIAPSASWLDKAPKGWKYKDPSALQDGVRKVRLKPGVTGKTQSQLDARGPVLPTPVPFSADRIFDQDPSVIVQWVRDDSATCWTSEFFSAKRNDGSQFSAKAP